MNVCILRLPLKQEIVVERSHCFTCGNVLKWYELFPIFSFLIQKGHCRNCDAKLSWQYPLVETACGISYILIFMRHGFTHTTVIYSLCASVLLVIAVIDWRTFEIPLGLNICIAVLGIVNLFFDLSNWLDYLLGAIAVSGLFLLIYLVTKGRGIGGGDVKLMAAAGLLLGLEGVILSLMIGAVAGSVIHLLLMKYKGKDHVLAFGPYLTAGIFITMLYGKEIVVWYLSWFGI